ncbi:MAG: 2,3-bisphosphoglycerate-independent phosphoglycerate mutase [Armatimonadota bacterium]|nr:2,3-bisphosphoglycerate-independent phosphoglycerate mutase [Armatimonadota bacterium]MCX7777281.1 2,3-bisphosphoglycerate-independent phosphoglycerate mutase [Armatimonadota bacterium]MDW8024402.1 2,3-bisphosphoglycerate-independent phosphoglycerate mutase [Armatimonadota bacterium]
MMTINRQRLLSTLVEPAETKLLLIVLDGLGGLPVEELGWRTELEAARTPNLDELARRSALGLAYPVGHGITPGSSPGHMALFGYDPIECEIGRGVLEAIGIGLELTGNDVAIRANFATAERRDGDWIVTDRRAGRIPTSECQRLCDLLQSSIERIDDVEVIVRPVKEHRFVVVFRGEGLGDAVNDTDPQAVGVPALAPKGEDEASERTAGLAARFIEKAAMLLRGEERANFVLLRGFSKVPRLPSIGELFKLNPCAIAVYPMYRGLAKLVGMKLIDVSGEGIEDEIEALRSHYGEFDYFFVHIKPTDSRGEDGDALGKVRVIEEFDEHLPKVLELNPDVLVITSDHSTPSVWRAHSWHPVPFLLHSKWIIPESDASGFNERACARGMLGHFQMIETMSLMLAHGGRLQKFRA